jgi:hypothetical protein
VGQAVVCRARKEVRRPLDAPRGSDVDAVRSGGAALLVASNPDAYRLTPHFEASPAFLLIWLEHIDEDEVRERLIDAWLIQAPKRLAAQHEFD